MRCMLHCMLRQKKKKMEWIGQVLQGRVLKEKAKATITKIPRKYEALF